MESEKAEAAEQKEAAMARIQSLNLELDGMKSREAEIEVELHGLKGVRVELLEKTITMQRAIDRMEREMDRIQARLDATFPPGMSSR